MSVVLVSPAGRVIETAPLIPGSGGYHEALVPHAQPGSLYYLEVGDGVRVADPISRFQPDGPDGPSEVIDPAAYRWRDGTWTGIPRHRVVYELHVGTFTPEGTWAAAVGELRALADLGVTVLEVLPIAEFPGRFGWGYDGVLPFAPTRLYGRPDDVRAFVDAAHQLGLGVILDVVYNHCGPDGSPLGRITPAYLSPEATEWGQGLNFDGPDSQAVREMVRANAACWITEFHFDGLRLDATQAIKDASPRHIMAELTAEARNAAAPRPIWIVGENEPQDARLLEDPTRGGAGLDALWNDDFHHAASVVLTGLREAYYLDYQGSPQEFVSAARHGFLYQGQWHTWQRQPRGTAARRIRADRFVAFLENHDQLANSLDGRRLHQRSSPGRYRALTALLLLGPWTPMLFQGQEYGATTAFLYFADHRPELAAAVRDGRRQFLAQFSSLDGRLAHVPSPDDPETFRRSQLDPAERGRHPAMVALHRSLLDLRRRDPAFHDRDRFEVDGAVLGSTTFVLRFVDRAPDIQTDATDRLLVVNLGGALELPVMPEPLVSPYPSAAWRAIWSSDAAEYGGSGERSGDWRRPWRIAAESATVLEPAGT